MTAFDRRKPSRPRRVLVALVALVATVVGSVSGSAPALAHDDIASVTPADRSTIDEPISSAEIDFGEEIGEGTAMFLVYDAGSGEDIDIGGDVTITGPTTARLDFPEIEREGTYFLQFLAPVPADGHVIAGATSFSYGAPTVADDGDENIRSSTPASRSVIDDPIDSVEIEFDLEITDELDMALVYDVGDGESFDDLGGDIVITGPRSVRLDFPEIEREGTYFVRYDGTLVANGDEIAGAVSFIWGEPSSQQNSFPIVPFVLVALPILALGAWFTYRRSLVAGDPESDDSESHDSESGDDVADDASIDSEFTTT